MLKTFKPNKGAVKDRVRKGRGNASGVGGECGRGHKGAKSRSGYSQKFGFEGGQTPLYRRVPKKRGFRNFARIEFAVLNLCDLEKIVKAGDLVDSTFVKNHNLVGKSEKRIKLLGNGEITKKITVMLHAISDTAKNKLEKAGAKVELIK
ncbi:MAG: 50S ribosomal protein L15 [Candidatus Margulisiibacteriota bacterium]|jgi:large subunit ribosomal protein L15